MQMILNTVRMVDHDQAKEHMFGDEQSLMDNLALAIINPEDFKKLNLTPSLNIIVSSKYGNVKLKTKQDKNVPSGTIIIPVSIWANQLTGTEGNEVIYKNISVEVEPTRDPILSFKALISLIKE